MDSVEVFFLILSCIDEIPFPNDMILDLIEIPDILTDNETVERNTLKLVSTDVPWECQLCNDIKHRKYVLGCCNKEICDTCTEKWFYEKSVKCPYCRQDIRRVSNKSGHTSVHPEYIHSHLQKLP